MSTEVIRFAQLLSQHVHKKIEKKILNKPIAVDETLLRSIRNLILETINDVFSKSTHKLSPTAISWLGNQYLRSIKLDGKLVDDMIVINDHPLSAMDFADIQLMKNLFNETKFGPELISEYNKRCSS